MNLLNESHRFVWYRMYMNHAALKYKVWEGKASYAVLFCVYAYQINFQIHALLLLGTTTRNSFIHFTFLYVCN